MTDENLPEIVQQSVVIDIHMSRSWELGLFLSKSAKKYLKNSTIFKHDFVATKLLVLTLTFAVTIWSRSGECSWQHLLTSRTLGLDSLLSTFTKVSKSVRILSWATSGSIYFKRTAICFTFLKMALFVRIITFFSLSTSTFFLRFCYWFLFVAFEIIRYSSI